MMHKMTILSGLFLSATCMVLHQPQIPLILGVQYHDTPNYNFAYDVNDAQTGDIKSQQESRRGDTVLGQYSLVQPDGIRRTVDYRADDRAGFLATVNNDGRPAQQNAPATAPNTESARPSAATPAYQPWPASNSNGPTPAPVAISRTSVVQTFSHVNNPWI